MSTNQTKPIVGFSCGDINGIGIETILKALGDSRVTEFCTPVIFASNKVINFYRKTLGENGPNYQSVKEMDKINPKTINVFSCWEEEVAVTPGQLNETGGKYAVVSLSAATKALKDGMINALVTAPLHKKNVQSDSFPYTGHTPFLKAFFQAKDVLMLMVAENMRVGLLTEHVPVNEVANHISKEKILLKLELLQKSLQKDFGVDKPRIAVLGLNPHAGDEGLVGKEEETIIKPALKDARQKNILAFGPYSADAFFARGQHEKFDAVLAMYHDQGLIPFKSLAKSEGVNYTAGLDVVRTSPDHGTAFDIAGKGKADETSIMAALFTAIDIWRQKQGYEEVRKNPLQKLSGRILARAVDEKLHD
ncbi:MAG: 4-hydroxythreonine-4-phosphate dehydrogenase PdxA [Bacteroidota bacterium]|jgi:4-hydroxythreonine-4-phosphate dehydrogenase